MRRQLLVAVAALCLVQFTDVLGVTVVVTALPSMLASLHAPQSDGTLLATGYAMFFGGLLMLGARLGDRYGHRRVILASLLVFAAGAAVAATASSAVAATAGRCLQGGAAAVSVPSALRLLTTITTEGPARRRAIAAWSAAGAAAGASGFVIGGIVTDLANWRVVFLAYIPLAAALGVVIKVSVPPDAGGDRPRSLNLAGSAAFTAAVMAFVVGTTVIARPGGQLAAAPQGRPVPRRREARSRSAGSAWLSRTVAADCPAPMAARAPPGRPGRCRSAQRDAAVGRRSSLCSTKRNAA